MSPPRGLLVNIDVDDLERAVAFYCQAFDLAVGRRFAAAVELHGLPSPLYLLHHGPGTLPIPGEPRRRRNYARHWTPVHLDFVVEDVHAALDRALNAGAHLDRPLATHDYGTIASLSDPFGNGFCLLEFSSRGYDAIAVGSGAAAPD